ncbi:caspase domain-containing protein [Kitasatospora sp. NPDC018619]|uniref:caspase family protein n=1 Tax=unclassified Kitasatospora TaxID=2633591 RepID=UPI00379BAA1C
MGNVHALLVGIDDYTALGHDALSGCVNDVTAAGEWLRRRVGERLVAHRLLDRQATVAAVRAGIREHLGQAGPRDTALLWYAGHGTEFDVRTEEEARIEATGRCQALVCADGPLVDKELAVLLGEVAATGAHLAVVLDCCYAGGATRRPTGRPAVRSLPADPAWHGRAVRPRPSAADARPGGPRDAAGARPERAGHLLLAASRLDQVSHEDWFDGRRHGVFTHALLGALDEAGPGASYREVMAAARCRVQAWGDVQHPTLTPQEPGGPADRPFLGGAVRPGSPHLLTHGADGWEVDCGRVHGLGDGAGGGTEFTVTGGSTGGSTEGGADGAGDRPGTVRARTVHTRHTLVDPVGWEPDRTRVYPVAPSALALPPTTVLIEPGAPAAERLLREAIATAGPGGGPSPLLRATGDPAAAGDLLLRVDPAGGRAVITQRDGTGTVEPLPLTGPAEARTVVDCLEHLTRWYRLQRLSNPGSDLATAVRIEILPWDDPAAGPLLPDGNGEIVRAYEPDAGGWLEPRVGIRLHNRSHRRLWCALFDLTDRYRSHSTLYRGDFVGPGRTGHALDGRPVTLSVPAERAVPGGQTRDWLKLIVAEEELNTVPFHLGAWDPARPAVRGGGTPDGVLRFTARGGTGRDLGEGRSTGRWATRTVALRTVVPGPRG